MRKAYAKINVGLRVIKKNEDGYHELEMINCKINLHDDIYIFKAYNTKIIYDKLRISKEEDVLYRMIMDLKYIYPHIPNLHIYIKKRIPIASGLGGMSSDAATILLYLNKRYNLRLSTEELKKFLLNYGTDMCYCLFNGPCLVKGIGEKVYPINIELPKKVILVYPIIKISTKDIYSGVVNYSNPMYNLNIDNMKWHNLQDMLKNDLEEVVVKNYPVMEELLKDIRNISQSIVNISGSGSSIIIYNGSKKLMRKLKKIYPHYLIGRFKVKEK